MTFEEPAPAKVNLSLAVRGRRADGYHELDSLVAFASIADTVSLTPGPGLSVTVAGPFGAGLSGEDNLIAKAVRCALAAEPRLRAGAFHLHKSLPVAAGLGGGSADAAAALRLLARSNADLAARVSWTTIASRVGADVPACLTGQAARMAGLGEVVEPIANFPVVACVLANPGVPLATADVFRALAAGPVPAAGERIVPMAFRRAQDVIAFAAVAGNDLEAPAKRLCPPVASVLRALAGLAGVGAVRMSGSGSTCCALFARPAAAEEAAMRLAKSEPGWWVHAATLR